MKGNDTLAKLIAKLDESKVTERLLAKEITGAVSISNEPDSLFYTSFSEKDAIAFYNIFEQYKVYSKENAFTAPSALKANLEAQCLAMEQQGICPVEIMLFSARLISTDLIHNEAIRRSVRQLVEDSIKLKSNHKSVFYILSGWEWNYILQLVLEACGKTNQNDLIRMAIELSKDLLRKYTTPSNIAIVKGYLNMLSFSQNMDYLSFYGDLYSIPVVTNNIMAQDELVSMLNSDPFISEHTEQIICEICSRNISNGLRNKLKRLQTRSPREGQELLQTLSSNLDILKKQQIIDEQDIDDTVLFAFENCRRDNIFAAICNKVQRDFDLIPNRLRSRAYILLGTKGGQVQECINKTLPFLKDAVRTDDQYRIPITVALAEYGVITYEDVFQAIGVDNNQMTWSGALGQYLRYRKPIIESELFNYIDQMRSSTSDEQTISEAVRTMWLACHAFNGRQNKLSQDNVTIVSNLIRIASEMVSEQHELSTYNEIFRVLQLIVEGCPSKAIDMLKYLDILKSNSKNLPNSMSLIREIDGLIKIADPPSEVR